MRFEARDGMGGPADYQLERTGVVEPIVTDLSVLRATDRAHIDAVAGFAQGAVDAMNMGKQTDKPETTNPK